MAEAAKSALDAAIDETREGQELAEMAKPANRGRRVKSRPSLETHTPRRALVARERITPSSFESSLSLSFESLSLSRFTQRRRVLCAAHELVALLLRHRTRRHRRAHRRRSASNHSWRCAFRFEARNELSFPDTSIWTTQSSNALERVSRGFPNSTLSISSKASYTQSTRHAPNSTEFQLEESLVEGRLRRRALRRRVREQRPRALKYPRETTTTREA